MAENLIEALRAKAISAVVHCTQGYFDYRPDGPKEGPLNADGYRYVIMHPAEFFMCRSCGNSGPWHRTWTSRSGKNERRALGPCCTGAD
jgi:hypothetical protein